MLFCRRSKFSQTSALVLFVVYLAALMASSRNPARVTPHAAHMLHQAANVVALILLFALAAVFNRGGACNAPAARRWGVPLAVLTVLTLNLIVRASWAQHLGWNNPANLEARFTRWDAMAAMVGTLAVLGFMYYSLIPRARGRTTVFALALVFALPMINAVPALFGARVNEARLQASLAASKAAYASFDGKVQDKRVVAERHGGVLYLAFAGTETKADVKSDLSIQDERLPAEWIGGSTARVRAHRGFVKLYAELRPRVLRLAKEDPGMPVVCCGHSLGGALATLAALDLATTGFRSGGGRSVEMYSFGAFRADNDFFSS